jgi:hypothetical protein
MQLISSNNGFWLLMFFTVICAGGCASQNAAITSGLTGISNPDAVDTTAVADAQTLSAEQRRLREQADILNRVVWRTTSEGVQVGQWVGVAIGLLSNDPTTDLYEAAESGGGFAGLAASYLADKQKQYAQRELVLESMVDDIRSKHREAANLIETLRIVIAEDRRQIDTLNAQLNQRTQTEADLQRQLAGVRADRQTITNALAKAQEQLTIFRESKTLYERQNPQVNTGQYGGEIESFQNQIDTMKRIAEQLNHPLLG